MNRRARLILLTCAVSFLLCKTAPAQVVMQPTPLPTVTAENEPWYLNGEPITHAGNLYYPAGPQVFFNQNEMVRSGFYQGIPLYSRTTIEPFSVVYVPIGRGRLQPYERPRVGELAQTTGSLPGSLPPFPRPDADATPSPVQAAGPSPQTTRVIPVQIPAPTASIGVQLRPEVERTPAPVGTAGRVPTTRPRAGRPLAPTAIFIEFEGSRWYMAGPAEPIDTASMTRAGYYHGVPVWSTRGAADGIIYVPVTQGGGSLAVPYSRRR